ncbi:MAG: efflux RND transporter periplasmic adaptor subunit [Planctomycetota bacterium]|jgi:HlyD family secretion protein|nr:efflux RND transporter periplasmic adaptor subunit [Planctomycetota bacterium]
MKTLGIIVVIALVAGGGYRYYRKSAESAKAASTAQRPSTVVAEKGDLRITVSATGRVEPEREVEIKSKASGEVINVYADVSDEVVQGMLLFKLDPTDEERSVARLRASLAMSQAKLEQMRLAVKAAEAKLDADAARANADVLSAQAERDEYYARHNRAEQLHRQGVVAREELDTARTAAVRTESALINAGIKLEDLRVQALELDKTRQEIPIAEAQVENDQVLLADAEQRLKETNVYAPITGVVSERSVQEGFIVASGVSNVGGGTTTMKLIDLSRIYAIAAVDEADISGVVPGVKAIITADAYKDREFSGAVVRVATTGVVESNVVTFDVKVEVEGIGRKLLKPEMTTNVTFLVDERKDVVKIPVGAVVRKAVVVEPGEAPPPRREGRPQGGPRPESGERPGRAANIDYTRRQSFVTVMKTDGTREERRVRTGISDGYQVEIVSGLEAGDEVVLAQGGSDSRWAGQGGGERQRPPR